MPVTSSTLRSAHSRPLSPPHDGLQVLSSGKQVALHVGCTRFITNAIKRSCHFTGSTLPSAYSQP